MSNLVGPPLPLERDVLYSNASSTVFRSFTSGSVARLRSCTQARMLEKVVMYEIYDFYKVYEI